MLAEYAATAVTILPQKEYGYRGGQLLITAANGDNARLRRFVEHLYLRTWGYLQQGKTQADVNTLVTALGQAGQNSPDYTAMLQTAQGQAAALFDSDPYLDRRTTNEQYIADLYLAYLQRPPESAAVIDYWAAPLNHNQMTRAQRRAAFAQSAEFAAIVSSLWGAEGNDYGRVERLINHIYQAATGALPGGGRYPAEHARFDAAEATGVSAVQEAGKALGRYLLGSDPGDNSAHDAAGNVLPAYRTDLDTTEYVRRLYETFLRRAPDENEEYWRGQANNPGRSYVLEQFLGMSAYREQSGAVYREIYWLVSDHLGTPRMIAERTGKLEGIKRNDYLPFGEQISAEVGGRSQNQGYVADSVRQGFTGHEEDSETGLTFAQARYYGSAMGRFISTDPVMLSPQRLLNPQQINLYAYAVNNPLFYLDSTGMEVAQLGKESEENLKKQIKEKEQLLKKDKKNEVLKADINALKSTLSLVQEGNKVAGAWLQALKDRGEDNGLTLSDLKISTDPVNDLPSVAKAAGENDTFISLGKYEWSQPETTATVIGKDIYILRPSNAYQDSLGVLNGAEASYPGVGIVPPSDIYTVGGTTLRHEQDHRDNRATETTAYTNQINLLDRINQSKKPFKNQEYFKKIREGKQNLLKYYQSREGLK